MSEHPAAPDTATSGGPRFDERLSVPLWWFLPALGLAVLLGAEVHLGYPGIRSWIGYAVTVPLCVAALLWLGRVRVRVQGDVLHAGGSTLDLAHVGRVDVVVPPDKQTALGPELDPAAHLVLRVWIRAIVRIEVTDPDATIPYWVISSRRPQELLQALGR